MNLGIKLQNLGPSVGYLVQDDSSLLSPSSGDFVDSFPAGANGVIVWKWGAGHTDGVVIGNPSTVASSIQSLDFTDTIYGAFSMQSQIISSTGVTNWNLVTTHGSVAIPLTEILVIQRYSCTCGNGVIDAFEQCDGGPNCLPDCLFAPNITQQCINACANITCQNGGTCYCGTCQCLAHTRGPLCQYLVGCDNSTTPVGQNPVSVDVCGVCGGNGTECLGCNGVPNGPKLDVCGICGGDGSTCYKQCPGADCLTCTQNPDCYWCGSTSTCYSEFQTNVTAACASLAKTSSACAANFFANLSPLAVGLGAGAIAGIVIAAVVAAGLAIFGGKKGYDAWKKHQQATSPVQENPLYQSNGTNNVNPLFEEMQ